jgi:hypothetical protein
MRERAFILRHDVCCSLSVIGLESKIIVIRGRRVMFDHDLAALYGTSTRRLNEQVRRNLDRFPEDFGFPLSQEEHRGLMSQSATSRHGGRRMEAKTPSLEDGMKRR